MWLSGLLSVLGLTNEARIKSRGQNEPLQYSVRNIMMFAYYNLIELKGKDEYKYQLFLQNTDVGTNL